METVQKFLPSFAQSAPPEYIPWRDPRVETELKLDNEDEMIQKVSDLVNSTQRQNFALHRHAFRGTHVKTQAVVKGTLTVAGGLPEHLSQGLFAKEGDYPVALRFANEPSVLADDRAPGPRGMGMRVFNVEGNHLDPIGDKTRTQDFTFNNAPVLELKTLPTTTEIVALREKYMFWDEAKLRDELKKRDDKDLQMAPSQLPNHHFLSYTFYSQSAYRYGKYVAKYALFPTGETHKDLSKTYKITDVSDHAQHSEWLKEYFTTNDAEFDFRVQLFVDAEKQSVEDCSVEWDESKFPFETVGKLVLPKGQAVFDPARRIFWEDKMKLNVWYGLEEHQPLGSTNRLRKELYKASAKLRAEINDTELIDVDSVDQIP